MPLWWITLTIWSWESLHERILLFSIGFALHYLLLLICSSTLLRFPFEFPSYKHTHNMQAHVCIHTKRIGITKLNHTSKKEIPIAHFTAMTLNSVTYDAMINLETEKHAKDK